MTSVLIRGDGVAAHACAHLLSSAGCRVSLEPAGRARLPAVLLTESTLGLLRDVFGQPDLLTDAPRIHRRVVAWGRGQQACAFNHSAVVVSEEELLASLGPVAPGAGDTTADWTICASRPLPVAAADHRFGERTAVASRVLLKESAPPDACWSESHEDGWLFLIPNGTRSAWLLSAGCPVEEALGLSRVVAENIEKVEERAGEFFAAPRIASPLYGASWIACGTAAIGFDPLCGDGTAYAVREAILASAVIRSAAQGGEVDGLLSLYASRMIAGFQRHLALCQKFYRTGYGGPWWDAELDGLERGIRWASRKLEPQPALAYRLNGFELEAIA